MDMAAAARCADVDKARALLLERAVRGAWHEGREVAIADLPDAVVAAVGEGMEAGDPQAETPLVLVCGRCDHRWQLLLDVASFLWNEVSSLAERLLFDVQALARAYGWSEAEILGMSAIRREFYLEHATKR
jgi:hypothetical protein